MTPFRPLQLPGRKSDRGPVVLVVLVLGVVLVSRGDAILYSWVLENHVLCGTRIDRSIVQLDTSSGFVLTARLFQLRQAKQFHRRCSPSKVIGTAKFTLLGMLVSKVFNPTQLECTNIMT